MNKQQLKELLDFYYLKYNVLDSVNFALPDPILKVHEYKDNPNIAYIALICALFSYGNVRAILNFLHKLDFDILDSRDLILNYPFPYYRFQTSHDVRSLFLRLYQLKQNGGLEQIIFSNYKGNILNSIYAVIGFLGKISNTKGFNFLIGRAYSTSPLKRWNMFMRWMVRKDWIDLGIWNSHINTKDLLLPLDVHTFRVCRYLGLLKRKTYDLKAVLEVSNVLKVFDSNDPIKYDFSLYRIGQYHIF